MPPITTNTKGDGREGRTAAKRSRARITITAVGVGAVMAAITFLSVGNPFNGIDNTNKTFAWGGVQYNEHADKTQAQIEAMAPGPYPGFAHPDFTTTAASVGATNSFPPNSNGDGEFRILCDWSHYGNDDPIVFPDRPGEAHLHLFWGNTETNADFTAARVNGGGPHDIMNNGGGTCQGNVMNRSAYWMPAMYSGPAGFGRQIVAPSEIIIYYKSKRPNEVSLFPDGLQMLAGTQPGGAVNASMPGTQFLHWGCYDGSQTTAASITGTIPLNCNEVGTACPAGNCKIQATIGFPECWDGVNTTSTDFVSHMFDDPTEQAPCPASHPVRFPTIQFLVRWDVRPDAEVSQWRLSSDQDYKGNPPFPGGSLHADWLGAWIANAPWIDGCFDPGPNVGVNNFSGPRNCSIGQTGENGTDLMLNRYTPLLQTTTSGYIPDPCPDVPGAGGCVAQVNYNTD